MNLMHNPITMKNNTLTLSLILALSIIPTWHASGQVDFGLRIAPNVGWIKPDTERYFSDGAKFGFSWGFVAEFPIANNHKLASGFNIIYSNGLLRYPDQRVVNSITHTGELQRVYQLEFLEIPLLLRLRTENGQKAVFFATIGLGTGFRLDAHSTDTFDSGILVISEDKSKITDEVTVLRHSLIVGMGIEYLVSGNTRIMAGLQFNNGFSDVLKGQNASLPSLNHSGNPNFVEMNIGMLF